MRQGDRGTATLMCDAHILDWKQETASSLLCDVCCVASSIKFRLDGLFLSLYRHLHNKIMLEGALKRRLKHKRV